MDTTLIFVRHGESRANGKGVFAGHLDLGLSERGVQQAELTAQALCKAYPVDRVYTSDLLRASHTALPIARACGAELVTTAQLREIFAGNWQGRSFDELQQQYAASYGVWLKDIGRAHPDGGESVQALSDRIWRCVAQIAQAEQGKSVVLVTHATPIRAVLCRLHGFGLERMKDVPWVSNASFTVVRAAAPVWSAERIGEDAHLSELRTGFPANV